VARIFITGSADGLGQLSAKLLISQGHTVVLHARNSERGREAIRKSPGAEAVLTGDLSNIEETKKLAKEVNERGTFDAVIHNPGVYQTSSRQYITVNTLAPYILTCLIVKPKRLIYLSSGMHLSGHAKLENLKTGNSGISYSDSKLHVLMLCKAVARKWPGVHANAVDPGWVPTKMGGQGAPDDLEKGYETQVWLAASNDDKAMVSGRYFFHQNERRYNPEAEDEEVQEQFLSVCREITGVTFP
jgi:NAD(P)-dependent dehydrogenase (short-subunit alcohol dehydrogenase family)